MRARRQGSMYPFERFSEQAKRTLTLAQEEAERSHHSYIGTEHLLLAMLRAGDAIAHRILTGRGVELGDVRERIASVLGRNERIIVQQIIPTSRVKHVIEIAFEEARGRDQPWVGTDHLLLALLIEGEGIAAKVLNDMGVTEAQVDSEMRRLHEAGVSEGEPGAGPPPWRPSFTRTPGGWALSQETQDLMRLAMTLAGAEGVPSVGIDHVERVLGDPDARQLLQMGARLRRIFASAEEAAAAGDADAAAARRREGTQLRDELRDAEMRWFGRYQSPPTADEG